MFAVFDQIRKFNMIVRFGKLIKMLVCFGLLYITSVSVYWIVEKLEIVSQSGNVSIAYQNISKHSE